MTNNLQYANRKEINESNTRRLRASDVEDTDVTDRGFTPVAGLERQGTNSKKFAAGAGVADPEHATGYGDFDFQDSGGSAVPGVGRFAVYESEDLETLARTGDEYELSDLRAAVSESRTDKEIVPMEVPFTGQDQVLVFEIKLPKGTSSVTVSGANTADDRGLPFSFVRA